VSELARHREDYMALRRSLGFKLESVGRLLTDFTDFAEAAGTHTITIDVAVAWAKLPPGAKPVWVSKRLSAVRGFAAYLHSVDPSTEMPPLDLLFAPHRRITPYVLSDDEIAALMGAARDLVNPLRAATFETFIGLLVVTGLRGGEAMRLDRSDVDWSRGLLSVRDSKFAKSRRVPIHGTTLDALKQYLSRRTELCPRPTSPSLFVTTSGTRLCHATVQPGFRTLVRRANIGKDERRPRVHDLRHSFAVRTLLRWYREGQDVQAQMLALSTYLGHADPGATYWYLSGTPELLGLAADRLEATFEVVS
jgi:integrase/recombinase XerD